MTETITVPRGLLGRIIALRTGPPSPKLAAAWAEIERLFAAAPEATVGGGEKCRAVKHGGTTLLCGEPRDHGESWHKATYTETREVVYDGSHHEIQMTETVTWEPVDHVHEATRHIMAGRRGTE